MSDSPDQYLAALRSIQQRSDYVHGHISKPRSGPDEIEHGLLRMRALLDELGTPDRQYSIVHVAGSKGKGSTSVYLEAIGRAAGLRTGLYTSPHLHSFRERIVLGGLPIDLEGFAELISRVERASTAIETHAPELGTVTAFELLTAAGLVAFADSRCEMAVVEVGLGGTLDATNVIAPVVSVITRLDYEHTQILGHSIAEIAENKAGIIKPGTPVITTDQIPEALTVLEQTARRQRAPLQVRERDFCTTGGWRDFSWCGGMTRIDRLRTGMAGPHQLENAALAIAAWQELRIDRGVSLDIGHLLSDSSEDAVRDGLGMAFLPGRFERVVVDNRCWILDGAHTPVAAAALATEVLDETGIPVVAIAGLLNDKHPQPFFEALAPTVSQLIVTESQNPRTIPAVDLASTARLSITNVIERPHLEKALQLARARSSPDMPILITGSLALVAEARELLGLAHPDPVPPV